MFTFMHDYWKNHTFDYIDLCQLSNVSAFYMLSWLLIIFLPKEQVSFNFMAAVTIHSNFGAQEEKICHCFHFPPIYLLWSDETKCHDLSFLNVEFLSQLFHSPLSLSSRGSLVCLYFLPLEWYHMLIWGCWYFFWQSWFQLEILAAQHFTWCTLHIS